MTQAPLIAWSGRKSLQQGERRNSCRTGGLPEEWWDCAMECYCFLRNVHDKMADVKTAFEERYGQTFWRTITYKGTLVDYIPITAKDKSRVHQFGKDTLKGIFLGYVLRTRRGRRLVQRLDDSRL